MSRRTSRTDPFPEANPSPLDTSSGDRDRDLDARLSLHTQILDAIGQAVLATDPEGRIIFWNRAAEELYGWKKEEVMGASVLDVTPAPGRVSHTDEIREQLRRGKPWSGEFLTRTKDGERFPVEVIDTPVFDASGRLQAIVGISRELTGQKRLERQVRQAQRMEAAGKLAGGVAHDFNNVLTAIEGHLTFLEDAVPADTPERTDLEAIRKGASRAAHLTEQLLAFSQRQVLRPRRVDLREVLRGTRAVAQALVGPQIQLETQFPEGAVHVRADPERIEQVILDLVQNAADATPGDGSITIMVTSTRITPESPEKRPEMPDGEYGVIAVADHGVGMSTEVLERVFEPFFSTRPAWEASGLGLSTAYGIIKQSRGFIYGESEEGSGSVFRIYLPLLPKSETDPA